jgi:hypothetical protein
LRLAACLIALPCILPGYVAHAATCDGAPCPGAAPAQESPLEALKSLSGVNARVARRSVARAASTRRHASKTEAIPLPRPRPPTFDPGAFPATVFAAVPLSATEDTTAAPARLVDDAFNAIAMHDDDDYPGLKAAFAGYRGRADAPSPAP